MQIKGFIKFSGRIATTFPPSMGGVGTHYYSVYVLTMVVFTNPET